MDENENGHTGLVVNPDEVDYPRDLLHRQGSLIDLELYKLHRELFRDPALFKVNFGPGQPNEHTERGYQRDPYNGVIIYNPTPATILVGFQAGMGQGVLAPAVVPPWCYASFPERFTNLSLGVSNADGQLPNMAPVTAMRCYATPEPAAGPMVSTNALQPLASLAAASSGAGLVLDHLWPRTAHTVICVTSASVTAGTVVLQGSHDGVNFANTAASCNCSSGNAVISGNVVGQAYRFTRAFVTAAIVGGTVNATIAGA